MRLLLVLLFLCAASSLPGQSLKVVKIVDCNLFELEDGRLVKLAGVDAPQLSNPIPYFAETAKEAVSYYQGTLLRRKVEVKTVSIIENENYELVYMWLQYPLEDLDLNQKFLENGFGKFFNNVDSAKKIILIEAEKYAKESGKGIWNYYKPNDSYTLDGDLRNSKIPSIIDIDAARIQYEIHPRPIYFSLPLELIVGSVSTIITGLAGGLLYAAIDQSHGESAGWAAVGFGALVGYLIGFSSGVYLVASHDNPDLSYWATIGSSVGFTFLNAGLSAAFSGKNDNHFTRYIAGLSPIIGPLLYVHTLAPGPPTEEEIINRNLGFQKISSFKDYYNSTMIFKAELFKINF